jgi:hypothetical protein
MMCSFNIYNKALEATINKLAIGHRTQPGTIPSGCIRLGEFLMALLVVGWFHCEYSKEPPFPLVQVMVALQYMFFFNDEINFVLLLF